MPTISPPTVRTMRDVLLGHGYPVWEGPYNLNLFGLRAIPGTTDAWDDRIGVLYQDTDGRWACESWEATTDPGRPWLVQPSRPAGCAILLPGHYRGCWALGLHRGKYPALVQRGDMDFARDGNRDEIIDYQAPHHETGQIGCNLHRASALRLVEDVGLYSAGCQVVRDSAALDRILELCNLQARHGHGARYSYSLIPYRVEGASP